MCGAAVGARAPWCTTSCLELPGLWREGLAARRGAGVCSGKTLVHVVAALISSRFSAWCKPPADVAPAVHRQPGETTPLSAGASRSPHRPRCAL